MAFMMGVVGWLSMRQNDHAIDAAARIPLEDEQRDG
jgi:hypothetical protein